MKWIQHFNNLMLQKRLIIVMLLIGLIPLTIVGIYNLVSASSAIHKAELNLLTNLTKTKGSQIEAYFQQMQTQISVLAENKTIKSAIREFTTTLDRLPAQLSATGVTEKTITTSLNNYLEQSYAAKYQKLNGDQDKTFSQLLANDVVTRAAQYAYISNNPHTLGNKGLLIQAADNSAYTQTHKLYHPEFKRYLDKFHFYDMFLIEAKSKRIVYSVYKEMDFATRLDNGPFKDSGLTALYDKAAQLKEGELATIVDFSLYSPSYDKPASFLGAPVYEEGELVGVLAFQMPIAVINKILLHTDGLGSTGEVYLVGSDYLMRSQSRFARQDSVINTQVDTSATKQLFADAKKQHVMFNYRGKEVISSSSKLKIPYLSWAIIADIEKSEALAAINEVVLLNIILGLVSALIVIGVAVYFAKGISNPINNAVLIAEKIAGGDLESKIESKTKCEAGILLGSLSKMQNNLKARLKADNKALAENTRIKQALDNISSNMLVVNTDNEIVYCNHAMENFLQLAQDSIQRHCENFDGNDVVGKYILSELLPLNQQELTDLTATENKYQIDFSIGDLDVALVANAVMSQQCERLGTVIEWKDRTLELAIEKEVQNVVVQAQMGNLSERISLNDKSGFYENLSLSVNQLVSVSENVTNDILRVMEAMAKGDLNQKIDTQYSGVFEELKHNVNATSDKLFDVVSKIQESAEHVKIGTAEISSANQDLATRIEEQSASLQQTSNKMGVIDEKMQKHTKFSDQAIELVVQSHASAMQGGAVVDLTIKAMNEIEQSSSNIADVISVIDSISFQINLLALNAAVEAARVGEHGKGFGVVASEVRKLASMSAESAKEISASIKSSGITVREGKRLANESGEKLSEIVNSVSEAADFVQEIALLNKEQSSTVNELNMSIATLDEISVQNAVMVEQTSKASERLGEEALNLDNMTRFFSKENLLDSREKNSP